VSVDEGLVDAGASGVLDNGERDFGVPRHFSQYGLDPLAAGCHIGPAGHQKMVAHLDDA
jgi:hypothetical protein